MRRVTSIGLLAMFFSLVLMGTGFTADEKSNSANDSQQEEQVAQPVLEDKDLDLPLDIEQQSWSNVKALWG